MSAEHWDIVAPYYRWALGPDVELLGPSGEQVDDNREVAPREPALHKFADTEFVDAFLGDPQAALPFLDVDHHHRIESSPRALGGKRRVRTPTRKLFQAAHSRFYLVAVALHCRVPGFPRVDPDGVEEVGFVIRRVRPSAQLAGDGATAAIELVTAQARARSEAKLARAASRTRLLSPLGTLARKRVVNATQASIDSMVRVHEARQELRFWANTAGIELDRQGWVRGPDERTGSWMPLPDAPTELVERTYRMRLLTPPVDDPAHPAHDQTIYWGVVPVVSDEVDAGGAARFTEEHPFEVRVYARPRTVDHCPASLHWSRPTTRFHMASFGDPDGCAQRPLELRMPSLPELAASTAPPSVRMSTPPDSALAFPTTGDIPSSGSTADGQICFVSIPLITIIATFVLNIFQPIVVFVFQLWWMLKLKFCLPPSLSLDATLVQALSFEPGELDLDTDLAIDLDIAINGLPPWQQLALRTSLKEAYSSDPGELPLGDRLNAELTSGQWLELAARQGFSATDGEQYEFVPRFPDPLGGTGQQDGSAPVVHVTFDQVVRP